MKALLMAALFVGSTAAMASHEYQVTGPVIEVTDTTITIDKKGEKFEIDKSAATKIEGEVKKGSKVTAHYVMTAVDVESKGDVKEEKKTKKNKK